MRTLRHIFSLWFSLLLATAVAEEKSAQTSAAKNALANRAVVLARAADNRELAALTQMAQARALETQAAELQENGPTEEGETETVVCKRVGQLQMSAAHLYGLAAANFDMTAANQQRVAELYARLGRAEQKLAAQASATGLKLQGDQVIDLAGAACEKASVVYDKAGHSVEVANASQQAVVWQEKLATR